MLIAGIVILVTLIPLTIVWMRKAANGDFGTRDWTDYR